MQSFIRRPTSLQGHHAPAPERDLRKDENQAAVIPGLRRAGPAKVDEAKAGGGRQSVYKNTLPMRPGRGVTEPRRKTLLVPLSPVEAE